LFGRAKTGGLGQVTTQKMENNEKKTGSARPRPDGGVMKKRHGFSGCGMSKLQYL